MMPPKTWFVSRIPLPLTSISLGRFVTVPENPPQNFFDPHEKLSSKPSPATDHSEILDVYRYVEKARGTKLELALTSFASAFFKLDKSSAQQLTSCRMARYFILNVDDWFDLICGEKVFRNWLERQHIRKRKAYLVTEYCTLTRPSLKNGAKVDVSAGVSVQIPAIAAATGIPVPSLLDPSLSIESGVSNSQQISYHVEDEKVFWIAYQQVKVTKTRHGDVRHSLAEKRRWIELCSVRDANVENFEIAADLVDFEIPADLEQLEADGDVFLFQI